MLGEHLDSTAGDAMPIDPMDGSDFVANRDPHQRKHARMRVNAKIELHLGNSCDRNQSAIKGICRDVSVAGFAAVLESPPQVGSIYWSSFEPSQFDWHPVFVRCMRCRLLTEDAYEAAFAFFTEQPIPQLRPPAGDHGDALL